MYDTARAGDDSCVTFEYGDLGGFRGSHVDARHRRASSQPPPMTAAETHQSTGEESAGWGYGGARVVSRKRQCSRWRGLAPQLSDPSWHLRVRPISLRQPLLAKATPPAQRRCARVTHGDTTRVGHALIRCQGPSIVVNVARRERFCADYVLLLFLSKSNGKEVLPMELRLPSAV